MRGAPLPEAPAKTVSAPRISRFGRAPDAAETEGREIERRQAGVQSLALFRNADPRASEEALADSTVLSLPAGVPLLRRGDTNFDIFVLLSGRLTAQLDEDASPDYAIELHPGDCIGELSAIDGEPISAFVVAATDVRVLRIDRGVFWNRLMLLPGIGQNLLGMLSQKMRRSNVKALEMLREHLELEHLRQELDLARELQASMLPLQRPMFPGRTDVEVCGFMEPASKVGGDLFDAFFVDSRTLFVCIGDVSGHGIAAAMFMVRVIGLLRILAMETTEPGKLLEALNDRLCKGNSMTLFVTLFCGFLDVETGRFVYSNGGHCAPMVSNGRVAELLPLPNGVLLGIEEGRRYAAMECNLAPGETLLCYTDGVTEAENPARAQFSQARCLEMLFSNARKDLPALLDCVFETVVGHCGSQVLADDFTMLAVRRPA